MQVIDPWGGSYMMESLTDAVYQEAMAIIKEVCAAGGLCPASCASNAAMHSPIRSYRYTVTT
jgi:methylmalonyl-CoA mutase N-terminal domain/subunit